MKIGHTPLGAIVSKKKILAGVTALTLIGGIAPALINNSYAAETNPYYDPDETIFAAVGPYYATSVYEELRYYRQNDYNIRITDTDVADFYESDGLFDCGYLECIQGKKIGDTEIVLKKLGEETIHIPVRSVELTPKAYIAEELGGQISITGSLNGADDSLLAIEDVGKNGNVTISRTGQRSISIRSFDDEDTFASSAIILWKIGNQTVTATFCVFARAEGVDNVYHLPENEEILKKAAINVLVSAEIFGAEYPGEAVTTIDGSVFRFENTDGDGGSVVKLQGALDLNGASASESTKNKLKEKLPDNIKDVTFKDITISVNIFTKREQFIPIGPVVGSVVGSQESLGQSSATDDDDIHLIGHYESLSEPITMVIDVSDTTEVANGYTRKWYVTRDNNGTIERIEASYDKSTKTIRFSTNIFGLHAYGYVDEKAAPLVPDTGMAPQKVAMVATATFAPLAVLTLGAFIAKNKKKASNKLAKKHNHFE